MPTRSDTTDVVELHTRAVDEFVRRVRDVPPDAWQAPTPCEGWDVHALVNHVVGEELWTVPLLEGRTIAEVGDRYDGDLLGSSPVHSAESAAQDATASFADHGAVERTVHLSFGDTPAREYAWQLVADHVVHAWDLAAATGGDTRLDQELVTAVAGWFAGVEELYRQAGAIGPRPTLSSPGDDQAQLLVAFGRDPSWSPAQDVVRRFGAAWEAFDMSAALDLMSDDAVFEATGPAPDGRRLEGKAAIREEWEAMARDTREPAFRFEEAFVSGDRATARWRFSWRNEDGSEGHVRGVDVIRVRDGLVVEKLSYVKG